MGYIRHHAIVVTGTYGDLLRTAQANAVAMGLHVSNHIMSNTNGVSSFLVAPDGSKEGWPESDDMDARRDEFKLWLKSQRYDDGSSPIAWVEVQYGDDDLDTRVVDDSDSALRNSEDSWRSNGEEP